MTYIRNSIFLYLLILKFGHNAWSQCDSGDSEVFGTAYALRYGGAVLTYIQAYPTGADSEYDVITIQQYDFVNGSEVAGSPLTSTSSAPGYEAETSREVAISNSGYGDYSVYGYVETHDTCNGALYPPYAYGGPYTNTASVTVVQPIIAGSTTLYLYNYTGNYSGGGSVPVYSNTIGISAYAPGTTGTPQWTFTGGTGAVTGICTSCNSMNLTSVYNSSVYYWGCSPTLAVSYTVDGLRSAPAGIVILSVSVQPGYSPTTNQPVDNSSIAGGTGYSSAWYYELLDSCGNPMQYTNMHEEFAYTYLIYPNTNWGFPTPNSWNVDDVGEFTDTIAQAGIGLTPTVLPPQSPLGTVQVTAIANSFYVDSPAQGIMGVSRRLVSQYHYQDHGVNIF